MNYDRCISCNATRAKSKELKYFRFPKDEERCKKWVLACNLKSLLSVPSSIMYKKYRLCSQHFIDENYTSTKKERLNSTACPSKFESFENSIIFSELRESLKKKLENQCETSSHSVMINSKSLTAEGIKIKEEPL